MAIETAATGIGFGKMLKDITQKDVGGLDEINKLLPEGEKLENVSDPQATLAAVTKGEYLRFRENFGQFEKDIVDESISDTSLIDQAGVNAMSSLNQAVGMQRRNRERYGGQMTRAQVNQQNRNVKQTAALSLSDLTNQAALDQRDINTKRFFNLIDVGQGVFKGSQALMGDAARMKSSRDAAARAASEGRKAQRFALAMAVLF